MGTECTQMTLWFQPAGKSALNRLELYSGDPAKDGEYKKIAVDQAAVETILRTGSRKGGSFTDTSVAYVLLNEVRRVGLAHTEMAQAQCGTIRLKLLKIGAQIKVSVRRVWVRWVSSYPFQQLFARVYQNLQGLEPRRC